ncbi:hypothetical protein BASA62_001208 [Batrachochytrium salamandrivorans]|nr:hypothetical protein BASA62_001208 [Batrachochytrium salamandrivorans]
MSTVSESGGLSESDNDGSQDISNTEKRRRLRADYRNVIAQAEENMQDVLNGRTRIDLNTELKQVNELFLDVKATQDAALDSKALLLIAEISSHKVQRLNFGGGSFTLEGFVSKLVTRLGATQHPNPNNDISEDGDHNDFGASSTAGSHDLKWDSLEDIISRFSTRVSVPGFMYGAIKNEPKQRERSRRTAKLVKDVTQLQRPEQLAEDDIVQQENETSSNVQMVYRYLEQVQPIDFFEFIINPESFSQSVENLFYLSFLIHDGLASINDQDGKLLLSTDSPPTEADLQQGTTKLQHILSLDMDIWEAAISAFHIRTSAIPTRKSTLSKDNGKWCDSELIVVESLTD